MASAATHVNPNTSGVRKDAWSSRARLTLLNLLLIVSVVLVYAPVRHYPFVNYDDPWYVAENPHIQDGLTGTSLRWALLEHEYCHNWHPLTWVSHAVDIQMFGLDAGAHHEVNVVLHALDAVLLFWVLRRATGYTGRSFMVAALFALHPINVESVAWISERKTVLSMPFFLLAFEAYRRYARKPTDARYALVAFLYILGLMAKPQVIALPLLLLLWDYWPLQRVVTREQATERPLEDFPQRQFWKLLGEKIPLLVIGAGAALMTMSAQEVGSPEHLRFSLWVRLENAVVSYAKYIGKALWPARLAPFYPHPGNSLTIFQVSSALALLLLISGLVFVGRRHRYLVVGWLWFLIALLPMIGLVQVWEQGMADRYAYQSFIGLFVMACWGWAECTQRLHLPAGVTAGLAAIVLLSLAIVARNQTRYWSNSVTLWTRSLQVTPSNNFIAEGSLGYVLMRQGHQAEAMPYLLKALQLRPNDPMNNLEVGLIQQTRGDLSEAVEHYKRALNASDITTGNRQFALTNLARAYTALGDASQARLYAEQAQELPSDNSLQPKQVY